MDLAYVPLYGADERIIGSINCDDPIDGRRPTAETFFYLELFADLAARKVESVQLLDRQRRTEEALRQSEEKYRTVFSRSGDGFFLMDELFRDCNSKACEIWHCNPEDIIGHSPVEFSPEYQPDGRTSAEAASEYIHKAMSGEPQAFYWLHKRKDGILIDCEVSLASVQVSDETLIIAIVRDITERKRAELERETILRILQIASSTDIWDQLVPEIFAEIGKLIPVENYFLALHDPISDTLSFPYFQDENDDPPPPIPLGNGLTAWIIRNGKPLLMGREDFDRMADEGEIELRGTPAASWLGVPLSIQSKTVGALVIQSYRREHLYTKDHLRTLAAIAAQIATALNRTRSDEALKFTQFTVDHAADGIFWIAENSQFLYVNNAACTNLGYSREELLNLTVPDLDPSINKDKWMSLWQSIKRKHVSVMEASHKTKDGDLLPVEVTANYIELHGQELLSVFVRDLSERKRSQKELVTLRKAVESSGEAVFMTDPDGIITFVNGEFTKMYGYDSGEVAGRVTPRILKSGALSSKQYQEFWNKILSGQVVKGEIVNRTKKGTLVTIESSVNPVRDDRGRIAGFLAIQRDVSQRAREEAALRESEENLRWLVENLDEAVAIIDMNEFFVYANPAMKRLFGFSQSDLAGHCLSEFMSREQFEIVREHTKSRYEGVRSGYRNEIRRPDGSTCNILVTATPQFDITGTAKYVFAVAKEIDNSGNANGFIQ